MAEYANTPRLTLESVLGYSGRVPNGLIAHPDGVHLLYPLGACIVVRSLSDPTLSHFLYGHNDKISCMAISASGRYVASGQVTHPGFQADVCIFDFAQRKLVHRMLLHKVRVQSLAFSPDERYLASVGGPDDNTVVLWDVDTGRPLCGAPAHHTETTVVAYLHHSSLRLVTGGVGSLRVWSIDVDSHKMSAIDVNMGTLRRSITAVVIEATDKYAYCGTTSGDVLCVQLQHANVFRMQGPAKKLAGGITAMRLTHTGDVLVGSGSGDVRVLSKINLTVQRETTVQGAVTGLALLGPHYYLGTASGNLYFVNGGNFCSELRVTCHSDAIRDVVYPVGFSAVFATCCGPDIRVWNAQTCSELLRIEIADRLCNCVQFSTDGSLIVSGWSDGKLRCFGPQSGRLVVCVHDAHKSSADQAGGGAAARRGGGRGGGGGGGGAGERAGVTAVCVTRRDDRIVTGGACGLVRVWGLRGGRTCVLEASMKEHKAVVNAIAVCHDGGECVSASDDGSCIVWDLTRFVRRNIMYSQTYFRAVAYCAEESQLLTCGSDKSITYWDSVECTAIREVAGSKSGELNTLSTSPDGSFFVTGGADRMIKVWDYDRGECVAVGLAHSCAITKVRVSPDGQRIVSVGDEGAVMVWRVGELDIRGL